MLRKITLSGILYFFLFKYVGVIFKLYFHFFFFLSCHSSYFSKTIDAYKSTYENNGGYNPSLSLASTKDFTADEVNKYKKIKEKNSASAFEKCGVKTKNIDSVKRVIYNVNVNNVPIREISFIMLQINGKWYVDFTQE